MQVESREAELPLLEGSRLPDLELYSSMTVSPSSITTVMHDEDASKFGTQGFAGHIKQAILTV